MKMGDDDFASLVSDQDLVMRIRKLRMLADAYTAPSAQSDMETTCALQAVNQVIEIARELQQRRQHCCGTCSHRGFSAGRWQCGCLYDYNGNPLDVEYEDHCGWWEMETRGCKESNKES